MSVEAPLLPSDATPRPVPVASGLAPGTTADWLNWAASELEPSSDSARTDAEVLLAALLDIERSRLRLEFDQALEAATVLRYASWIERRKGGEPVAYITGRQGFWTLDLAVDTSVLIPRADTETLVEWAISLLERRGREQAPSYGRADVGGSLLPTSAPPNILDLGTGSGAIALSLAQARPDAGVIATDFSATALELARHNARANGIENVEFREGSWLSAIGTAASFDLIVSNPPYIAEGDSHMASLRYEPRLALTAGSDGLDAIREIVREAPAYLAERSWLLLEHGHDQAIAVQQLLAAQGFTDIETRRDLGGNERVTGGRKS